MRPRHVLITGGSRGIGLAIAQLFAKNAYRCTLLSRSEEDLKNAVASLTPLPTLSTSTPTTDDNQPQNEPTQSAPSYNHTYIPSSIASESFWSLPPAPSSSVTRDQTQQQSSPNFTTFLPKPPRRDPSHPSHIDVLVNCAGITQTSLFSRTSNEEINSIVSTNLTGVMQSTRFLLRQGYLRGRTLAQKPSASISASLSHDTGAAETKGVQQNPVIINIASLLGISGGHGAVAYAASKAGLLGFTRALATEYASHGVRVNAVVPGYVGTGMTADLNEVELAKRIPLGRFGTTQEIATAALFLAENEYAHNCVLNLDGGLSAI